MKKSGINSTNCYGCVGIEALVTWILVWSRLMVLAYSMMLRIGPEAFQPDVKS